jgi:AcrR family transcriptional regulator
MAGTATPRRPAVHAAALTDETTRERIIAAADELFYGRGVQSVGMDAIRSAAGVSLKRLYQLFPSKEDLVEQMLQNRHRSWTAGMDAAAADASDAVGALLAIYDYLADWFQQENFRGCAFINCFGELGATSPRIAAVVRQHKADFRNFVARLVADAGAPPSLAPQLALLAEGAQTTAAIAGTDESAHQARNAAQTLIHAALAA